MMPKFQLTRILRRSYPFLIVLGLEVALVLYLLISYRGVIGHDAFQYFGLQYYFLNNAVNSGETALWLPLMTQGTVSNWWYAVQASMLQGALLAEPLPSVLSGLNFLPIYYVGILFDEALLLLGIWLLGRRYFASNLTVLFVCISALGSATWFTQPWHNLHFYYAVPLILHFIHELLDTGRWRYLLLAGNLFAVQCCGSLPYYIPLTSLIICLYTLFYIFLFWTETRKQLCRLLVNWKRGAFAFTLVAVSLYAVYTVLFSGTDLIANYNVGRLPDGSVTLETFLKYGTNSNLRWFELLSRVSPSLDYSVYFGYLASTFAALAVLMKWRKPLFLIGGTALIVLCVANATPLATVFYYLWPTMRYFRHLSLASTIVRVLLCFVAGFGFEQILLAPAKEHRTKLRIAIFAMAEFALMLFIFSRSYLRSLNWISASVLGTLHNDRVVFQESYLLPHLALAALWCLGACAFLAAVAARRFPPRTLAVVAIAFQALDIYSFKFDLAQIRTLPLTTQQYEINRLQDMPFSTRRLPVDYERERRARYVPQNHYASGAHYWTADSYMFTDPPANRGRADHWLWSFDDFLRAFAGEELRDSQHRPRAFRIYDSFLFPVDHAGAMKAAGVTEDKIQFFSKAHKISSDREIARLLASDSVGDVLLISGSDGDQTLTGQNNDRVQLTYTVTQFDSNNIRISVPGADPGTWLYYADSWHPAWHVSVNGKEAPLSKANLGFKAVQLAAGENTIHFRFQSTALALSTSFLNWNALIWLFLVPCLVLLGMNTEGRSLSNSSLSREELDQGG